MAFCAVAFVGAGVAAVVRHRQRSGSDGGECVVRNGLRRGFLGRGAQARQSRARSGSPTSFRPLYFPKFEDSSRLRARSGSPTGTGRAATWKEFSGRVRGGDGYRFGDITHGQLESLRVRYLESRVGIRVARAHGEAAAAAPAHVAGLSRDMTQDFKALRLRQREKSLAQVPQRRDFKDAVSEPRPAELRNLLKEGASEAGAARQQPQLAIFCSEQNLEMGPCGKSLWCERRPIADYIRGSQQPSGAADELGKLCHICRQWFCPDCRPHQLEPRSVALLVGEARLGGLGPIKCCVACHGLCQRLAAPLRSQHDFASGTGLTDAQRDLTCAFRGVHEHRAQLFEALDMFEQNLRVATSTRLDSFACEEFGEIFKEDEREAELSHRYFLSALEELRKVQVTSPFDQDVKRNMENRFKMVLQLSTARLRASERAAQGFEKRNSRGG